MDGSGTMKWSFSNLLINNKFLVVDIGDDGSFCKNENINIFYPTSPRNISGTLTFGTMRFRTPYYLTGFREKMLYHPVEPLDYNFRYFLNKFRRLYTY